MTTELLSDEYPALASCGSGGGSLHNITDIKY
jgi:hypothetical protein